MPQSPLPLLVLLLLLPPSSQHLHYPRNLHFLIFSIARKKRLSHWSWRTKHHCHVRRSSWPYLSRSWLQSWKLCYWGFQPIWPNCRTDSDSVNIFLWQPMLLISPRCSLLPPPRLPRPTKPTLCSSLLILTASPTSWTVGLYSYWITTLYHLMTSCLDIHYNK